MLKVATDWEMAQTPQPGLGQNTAVWVAEKAQLEQSKEPGQEETGRQRQLTGPRTGWARVPSSGGL